MCKEMEVLIAGLIWLFVFASMIFPGASNAQVQAPVSPPGYLDGWHGPKGMQNQGIVIPVCK